MTTIRTEPTSSPQRGAPRNTRHLDRSEEEWRDPRIGLCNFCRPPIHRRHRQSPCHLPQRPKPCSTQNSFHLPQRPKPCSKLNSFHLPQGPKPCSKLNSFHLPQGPNPCLPSGPRARLHTSLGQRPRSTAPTIRGLKARPIPRQPKAAAVKTTKPRASTSHKSQTASAHPPP